MGAGMNKRVKKLNVSLSELSDKQEKLLVRYMKFLKALEASPWYKIGKFCGFLPKKAFAIIAPQPEKEIEPMVKKI
jgi:hypothetical protein